MADPGGAPETATEQARRAQRRVRRRRRKARAALAGLGRSRGGLTSKIHLAAETGCRPLCLLLTAGQAGDSPQFVPVLDQLIIHRPGSLRPRTRPTAVAADKAYGSKANRAYLRRRAITAVIPVKDDQAAARRRKGSRGGRPPNFNAGLYRERNVAERCINRLKTWRGIATRYDKRPDCYLAALHLRGAMLWLRQPTRT